MTASPIDGPAATASSTSRPPLTVLAQYLKDLSFENPNAPEVLAPGSEPPRLAVQFDVRHAEHGPGLHEVSLLLRVEATVKEDKVAYLVDMEYAGLFQLGDLPAETIEPMVKIDAPRLLFPFARAILAAAVSDGGFPKLLIGPIDFALLYRQRRRADREATLVPTAG